MHNLPSFRSSPPLHFNPGSDDLRPVFPLVSKLETLNRQKQNISCFTWCLKNNRRFQGLSDWLSRFPSILCSEAHNLCNLPGHLFTFSPARDELVDQSSPTNLPSVSSLSPYHPSPANSDIKNLKHRIPMWPVSGPGMGKQSQNCWPTDLIQKNTKSNAHENFHASLSI